MNPGVKSQYSQIINCYIPLIIYIYIYLNSKKATHLSEQAYCLAFMCDSDAVCSVETLW